MTEKEATSERIKLLENEIVALRKSREELLLKHDDDCRKILDELRHRQRIKELALIKIIKKYDTLSHSEINAIHQSYRQSLSWRLGRIIVKPLDLLTRSFFPKRKRPIKKTKAPHQNKPKSEGAELPDFEFDNQVADHTKTNIAVIFDTFTQSCFSHEFNTICFTPGNWRKVLETNPVKALFIESAWRGIGDTWKKKLASNERDDPKEWKQLLDWAKQQGLPTIFWNKEDPVHFNHFIGVAKNFDFIFTTDAECIPRYQKEAKDAIVNALPFAAQPLIHNPIVETERTGTVCFAGTYYNHRYHERKTDMDFLLKPAIGYGLEIYDRNFGKNLFHNFNLAFPPVFNDAIRGKLEYDEMVKAYKQYKVFLNVNSVRNSPTMFARRVFEILASGTPVISTYSKGILNLLGEDTVFITESEADTRKHLDFLLGNEQNWWKASLNGLRKVMEHHTYQERTRYIFEITGFDPEPSKPVKFTIAARVPDMEQLNYLEKLIRQQTYTSLDIALVISGEEIDLDKHSAMIHSLFEPYSLKILPEHSKSLEKELLSCSDSDYIAFFHANKYYGPNYLRDYALARKYANPKIMGKRSFYQLVDNDSIHLSEKGYSFQFVMKIPNATSVHRKMDLDPKQIRDYLADGCIFDIDSSVLSIDPYNYLDIIPPVRDQIFSFPILREIDI